MNDIYPNAFIDGNGQAWLSLGKRTLFLSKFKPNLIELGGEVEVGGVAYLYEGPVFA